jgi:hypothetical protein
VSGSGNLGKSYAVTLETLSEHESEEESEENNKLLIDEMIREKNNEHKDSQVEGVLNLDNETYSDMVMDDQRHQNPSLENEGQKCVMINERIGREECDIPVDTGKALIIHTPVTSVWTNLSMFAPRTPCVNNELVCCVGDSGKNRLGMSSYASILSKEVWPPLIQEVDSGEDGSPQRVEVS